MTHRIHFLSCPEMKAVHNLGVKSLPFGKEIPWLFQLLYFGECVWSKGKFPGPNKVLKFKKKKKY